MRNLLILLLIVLSASCDKNLLPGVIKQTQVEILLLDNNGDSLLLNANSGYKYGDIKLYYYDVDMEYTRRFDINRENQGYIELLDDGIIRISTVFGEEDGTYVTGGRSTTYIDFGNGDIDTLQVSGIINGSNRVIKDAWYNNIKKDLDPNWRFTHTK